MSFQHYNVDKQDLYGRAISRTLLQFRNKPVFTDVLLAMISQVQEFSDACTAVLQNRAPADATGYALEAIGRIVGQIKQAFDYGRFSWFAPDDATYVPDKSLVWVKNAPIGTMTMPDDGLFRQMIEFKVFRNFMKYGSIPEIQTAISTAFGVNVSFQAVVGSDMDWNIIVSKNTPEHIKSFLTTASSNEQVDSVYLPPYPMTWRIVGILYREDLP